VRVSPRFRSWLVWRALVLILLTGRAFAQSPVTFQYYYDELNQLAKVVDSTGIVIDYVYDPVGNILQINRSTVTPGALTIFNFSPQQIGPLATLTIQGQGFGTTLGANTVLFNGVSATVVSATSTTLVVTVPVTAASGPISVTVGGKTVTSSTSLLILPTPVISSITPRGVLANTQLSITVNGVNLTGSTFVFVPAFSPPAIGIGSFLINASGTSATLNLTTGSYPGKFTGQFHCLLDVRQFL
jgi:YD repeat-containing protein